MLILYIPKINPKQGELTYKSDSAPNHFAYIYRFIKYLYVIYITEMVHMILYIHSDISKIEMKNFFFHKPKNKSKLKKSIIVHIKHCTDLQIKSFICNIYRILTSKSSS